LSENILVATAWPYTNNFLHLGHIAGCYLPADIFARYQRARGNKVIMVSGSDQHGTPVTIAAEAEGVQPIDIVNKYRKNHLEVWKNLGISYDLFTTTGTENHIDTVQDIFTKLYDKGLIYKKNMTLLYSEIDNRFLADRYVEGTCPDCKFERARGDQCDQCGKPMDALELINPISKLSGDSPIPKESEHFFLKLSALEQPLLDWIKKNDYWKPNVKNFSLKYLTEGLKDRAITRDIEWGIPIPLKGYETKRIYVWFEAVIGYLSASKEWAQIQNKPDEWQKFWFDKNARSYYFLGKDNIPFHTIIWPGILLGYENHNLPYDVPANEYMNLSGGKFSKSENRAVWAHEFLEKFSADALRYYIVSNMPENSDSDFTWEEFLRRNNDELVATLGNLIHRILTFTFRNFDSKIPESKELKSNDEKLISEIFTTKEKVESNLDICKFRESMRNIMNLAQNTNRYLDSEAPWHSIKTDKQRAGTTMWVALYAISAIKTFLYPFMPNASIQLGNYLGISTDIHKPTWEVIKPESGTTIESPLPLFKKLEIDIENPLADEK
tara:strand:+ start:829 stop:2487 length:1659 start_codon:yes stop_codon:yes gene_type:complete